MKQESLTTFPVYYQDYVAKVSEQDPVSALKSSGKLRKELLSDWPRDREDYAYAEGKWTVKELLVHLMDSERILSCRALRFCRNDQTELPGYDHDGYVPRSHANARSLKSILKEMRQVRKASLQLFKNLSPEQLASSGIANGLEMTVEQLGFIIAGHERHHLEVLRERYSG